MQQPLFPAAPEAPTAPSEATDAPKPAAKPRSARKAPSSGEKAPPKVKAPKEKPPARGANPHTTIEFVGALASAAGRRFAMGNFAMWHKSVKANASATVLAYPDVALWKLVGEALAANADGAYAVLGPSRITTRWFSDTLGIAQEWDASGRQRDRDARPFVARAAAAPTGIPRGYDPTNLTPEQQRAKLTGKAVSCGMPEAPKSDAPEHEHNLEDYPDCPVLSFGGAHR